MTCNSYYYYTKQRKIELLRIEPEPTIARPGSEEKIKVLMFRYAEGLSLWHENDEKVLTEKKC